MRYLIGLISALCMVCMPMVSYAERIVGKIGDGPITYASDLLFPLILVGTIMLGVSLQMLFFENRRKDAIDLLFILILLVVCVLIFNII